MDHKTDDKFVAMGTKISPEAAIVWNAICDARQTDTYHMLQNFIYTMIRAAADPHRLNPDIKRILTMLETDAGWQQAFNLATHNAQLNVAQVVLILEQEGRKGFGAVMIDKPFMGNATMTECTDDILERVCEVTMRGIYRRLRLIGARMECNNLSDVLLTLIDAQTILELEEEFQEELPKLGDTTDNGKRYAYGKKTKSKHRRTPDGEARREQRIHFNAEDVPDLPELKSDNDEYIRPFGEEW